MTKIVKIIFLTFGFLSLFSCGLNSSESALSSKTNVLRGLFSGPTMPWITPTPPPVKSPTPFGLHYAGSSSYEEEVADLNKVSTRSIIHAGSFNSPKNAVKIFRKLDSFFVEYSSMLGDIIITLLGASYFDIIDIQGGIKILQRLLMAIVMVSIF